MNDIPAFPVIPPLNAAGTSATGYPFAHSGMTLRDYFAASALPAVFNEFFTTLRAREIRLPENWTLGIARDAFAMADAMLVERSKKL